RRRRRRQGRRRREAVGRVAAGRRLPRVLPVAGRLQVERLERLMGQPASDPTDALILSTLDALHGLLLLHPPSRHPVQPRRHDEPPARPPGPQQPAPRAHAHLRARRRPPDRHEPVQGPRHAPGRQDAHARVPVLLPDARRRPRPRRLGANTASREARGDGDGRGGRGRGARGGGDRDQDHRGQAEVARPASEQRGRAGPGYPGERGVRDGHWVMSSGTTDSLDDETAAGVRGEDGIGRMGVRRHWFFFYHPIERVPRICTRHTTSGEAPASTPSTPQPPPHHPNATERKPNDMTTRRELSPGPPRPPPSRPSPPPPFPPSTPLPASPKRLAHATPPFPNLHVLL
ncbi:hypothetical protein Tdes44962_MAKER10380, partial [Teratosphaeria destructans]